MTNQDLHQAFLNTTFKVLSNPEIYIKIDSFFPELQYLNSWAFITAWNPLPDVLSLEQNIERNLKLEKDCVNKKFNFVKGIGISQDGLWSEESLFIENISLEMANEWAAKYNQKAFAFGLKGHNAQLIYTTF